MRLVNIGFGNMISAARLLAVVGPDSAPIRRIIQDVRERGMLIDATYGRKTKAVLFMDSGHVILSALQTDTVAGRIAEKSDTSENSESNETDAHGQQSSDVKDAQDGQAADKKDAQGSLSSDEKNTQSQQSSDEKDAWGSHVSDVKNALGQQAADKKAALNGQASGEKAARCDQTPENIVPDSDSPGAKRGTFDSISAEATGKADADMLHSPYNTTENRTADLSDQSAEADYGGT